MSLYNTVVLLSHIDKAFIVRVSLDNIAQKHGGFFYEYENKGHVLEQQILFPDLSSGGADHHPKSAQRGGQFRGCRHAQLRGAVLDLGRIACIQLCKRSLYGLLRAGHRRHDIERTVLGPEGSAGNSGDRRNRATLFPADRAGFLWLRPADTG